MGRWGEPYKWNAKAPKICLSCGLPYLPKSSGQLRCLSCLPDKRAQDQFNRYKITEPQFLQLLSAQQGACPICASPITRATAEVDHDHSCCPGKVACGGCSRGLLCHACNCGVGICETPNWLTSAQTYVATATWVLPPHVTRHSGCLLCAQPFTPGNWKQQVCKTCLPTVSAWHRWKKYGVSHYAFLQRLEAQAGVCAICSASIAGAQAHVDHKHGCCPSKHACDACRRGLLCTRCNVGLHYVEQPGWLDQAALYLQRRS